MKLKEILDLKAKSFLVLKGLFVGTLNPLTLQQIHPAQMGAAAALHQACCNQLQLFEAVADGGVDRLNHVALCQAIADLVESGLLHADEMKDAKRWLGETLEAMDLQIRKINLAGDPEAES